MIRRLAFATLGSVALGAFLVLGAVDREPAGLDLFGEAVPAAGIG